MTHDLVPSVTVRCRGGCDASAPRGARRRPRGAGRAQNRCRQKRSPLAVCTRARRRPARDGRPGAPCEPRPRDRSVSSGHAAVVSGPDTSTSDSSRSVGSKRLAGGRFRRGRVRQRAAGQVPARERAGVAGRRPRAPAPASACRDGASLAAEHCPGRGPGNRAVDTFDENDLVVRQRVSMSVLCGRGAWFTLRRESTS